MKLILGDCLDKLKELADSSVDSVVTDPPYGLSFMGKSWDYAVPSVDIWRECLRVLKPGGHLLSFAGSRTYHRMVVGIEDVGFEIRDQIMWIYGSGFPKSHNIGKVTQHPDWEGWGTALKPAHEPIVMARKPLSENTVADNVLEWGTGGINIDDSRIPLKSEADKNESTNKNRHADFGTPPLEGNHIYGDYSVVERKNYNPNARFPSNIILDEEAGKILDEQSGISKSSGGGLGDIGGASRFFYCPKTSKRDRNDGLEHLPISRPDTRTETGMGSFVDKGVQPQQNIHPTVKPTDLMLYLIRMVTPKGGTTLDPFMGSGSTGKAAVRGGFDFIGIEREKEYMEIAEARIQYEIDHPYVEEIEQRISKETVDTANKFFHFNL